MCSGGICLDKFENCMLKLMNMKIISYTVYSKLCVLRYMHIQVKVPETYILTVTIRELGKNNKLKCFCIITHNLEIPLLYFSILVSIKFNDQNKQTHIFNSLHAGYLHIFGLLLIFGENYLFQKVLSECQTVRFQIGHDKLSGLVCV